MLSPIIQTESKMAAYQDLVAPHKDWPVSFMSFLSFSYFYSIVEVVDLVIFDL